MELTTTIGHHACAIISSVVFYGKNCSRSFLDT